MTTATTDAPARWRDLFRSHSVGRVLARAGGEALHAINLYVTATVLPNVASEIGGLPYYAWATTLFVIASIISAALLLRTNTASFASCGVGIDETCRPLVKPSTAPQMSKTEGGRSDPWVESCFIYRLSVCIIPAQGIVQNAPKDC